MFKNYSSLIRIILILTVFCTSAYALNAPGSPSRQQVSVQDFAMAGSLPGLGDAQALEAFLDGVVAMQLNAHHLAGATLAIVKGDEILLAKGYGFADIETSAPVDPEKTLFRIGSITKVFTWIAVMQLVEAGKLDLETDINSYLDFEIPDTFAEPITLKHLMTHTAGFEEMGFGLFAKDVSAMVPNREWLASHIPARVWAPGKLSAYSNYGAALAGYIVERLSGMPYETYIEQRILEPLAMQASTARQPLPAELAASMSQGYQSRGERFVALDFELVNAAPAGSISASATDMAHFMIAQLNGGAYGSQRILAENTARTMHNRLWGADPRLNGWAYGLYELSQNGQWVIGHGGDTRLFHSLMALLPEQNLGFFVSYNTETNSMAPQEIFTLFMDRYFSENRATQPRSAESALLHADQVSGSYRLNRTVYTRAGKIDSLLQPFMVQAEPDGTLVIPSPLGTLHFVETAPYYYEQIGGEEKAVFWVDAEGSVTHSFINSFPMMAAERLPWYEAAIFHLVLAAFSLFMAISTLVAAVVGFFVNRAQGGFPRPKPLTRLSRWVLAGAGLLCILFVTLYAISLADPMLRLTGQRAVLDTLSWIALIIILLAPAAIALTATAWIKKTWGLAGRIHYTLASLGIAIFAVLLIVYQQVGWQW